ncbi:MAG: phospholipase D-like domain-containing protein [Gemmatimonadota bacterium]
MGIQSQLVPFLVGALGVVLSVVTSIHAITTKREVRAAIGWVGLAWLVPFLGAAIYAVAGVNRIRRRGGRIRRQMRRLRPDAGGSPLALGTHRRGPPLEGYGDGRREAVERKRPMAGLAHTSAEVTGLALTEGNHIEALVGGDEAYPAMLEAIEGARRTIGLSTYIFDQDEAGRPFVEALAAARDRGVEVRVLLDAVGALYSRPRTPRVLSKRGIRNATFLRSLLPWRAPFINLRNHRKLLLVDGEIGFTGGLNIRSGCRSSPGPLRIRDLHFRLRGPVVAHLAEAFAGDWIFTTRERLEGSGWFPELEPCGEIAARGISDGPDEDFEVLRWTLLAALATARRSIRIVTPYFLPDQTLVAALNLAALRGVTVDIVLPRKNNLRLVEWAMMGQIRQVLKFGCRVWLSEPPFDHSKLMVVDGAWTLFGSANWDPRSLRLNFEFDVEAYDESFAAAAETVVWSKIEASRRLSVEEVDGWSWPKRIRNGVAWLASPYL